MTGLSLLEIGLLAAALVVIFQLYLQSLGTIQARSDLAVFDRSTAILLNDSFAVVYRFFIPLVFGLVALSSYERSDLAALFHTLLFLVVILFMIWALCAREICENMRQQLVTVVTFSASFFLISFLAIAYSTSLLTTPVGVILSIFSWGLVFTALAFVSASIWRYLGSDNSCERRIKKLSPKDDDVSVTKSSIIREFEDRKLISVEMLTSNRENLWQCAGDRCRVDSDEAFASEVLSILGDTSRLRLAAHIYIGVIVLSLAKPLTLTIQAVIDARYMNRVYQRLSGGRVWRWPSHLKDFEEAYAELDVQTWKVRPFITFYGSQLLALNWLVYDYARHPNPTHRRAIAKYIYRTDPYIKTLAASIKSRCEIYQRLVSLSNSIPLKTIHEKNFVRVKRFQDSLDEVIRRRTAILDLLATSDGAKAIQ